MISQPCFDVKDEAQLKRFLEDVVRHVNFIYDGKEGRVINTNGAFIDCQRPRLDLGDVVGELNGASFALMMFNTVDFKGSGSVAFAYGQDGWSYVGQAGPNAVSSDPAWDVFRFRMTRTEEGVYNYEKEAAVNNPSVIWAERENAEYA